MSYIFLKFCNPGHADVNPHTQSGKENLCDMETTYSLLKNGMQSHSTVT